MTLTSQPFEGFCRFYRGGLITQPANDQPSCRKRRSQTKVISSAEGNLYFVRYDCKAGRLEVATSGRKQSWPKPMVFIRRRDTLIWAHRVASAGAQKFNH